MNFHQGLKSEMEARSKSIAACLELGKTLILAKSPAADEVLGALQGIGGIGGGVPAHVGSPPFFLQIKALAEKLLAKKKELAEKWDKHWEWLQQSERGTGSAVPGGSGGRGTGARPVHPVLPSIHPPVRPSVPQCWRSTSSPRRRWWPTRG